MSESPTEAKTPRSSWILWSTLVLWFGWVAYLFYVAVLYPGQS